MQAAVADGKILVAKAEAAAISDLQLDPTRLHIDPAAAPLGIGSSADTRRGTYRFPGKADATDVALKVFRGGQALSGAARDQIVREVRVGSKLHHENLVRIYGIVEVPTHGLVLVMELACGGALRDVLCDHQRYPDIPWDVRLRWLVGIAEGMAQLHSLPQAIIHRDLKTANVLLTSAGADLHQAVAKICDFGLAKASATLRGQSLRGVAASSSPGGIVGTLPGGLPLARCCPPPQVFGGCWLGGCSRSGPLLCPRYWAQSQVIHVVGVRHTPAVLGNHARATLRGYARIACTQPSTLPLHSHLG